MDVSNFTKDMERIELPKMKKAVVSLQKLDMLTQMPVSENGSDNTKEKADIPEENEDPSSENSTGSAESNVICTDDDDLEKKIQAFSIPVKKDDKERQTSKTDNESIKSHGDKGSIVEKERECIKPRKKQMYKSDSKTKEKSAVKAGMRTSAERIGKAAPNADCVSRRIRKKENVKNKVKTYSEKKPLPQGSGLLAEKGQELKANFAKLSDVNSSANKAPSEHNLRNGKGDKHIEKNIEKKTKKEELGGILESAAGSEVSRKRKALKGENTQIQAKKFAEKKSAKLTNEPTSSAKNENKKGSIDLKLRSSSVKRKQILPSKVSSKLSDHKFLHVKRSARISDANNRSKYIGKSTEKNLRNNTQRKNIELDSNKQQKTKIEVRKRHANSKDRGDVPSKLKTSNEIGKVVEKKIKDKTLGKNVNTGAGKKAISRTSVPKESTKEKVTGVRKDSKQTCIASEKENSNSRVEISETKSDNFIKKVQTIGSDVFDDGEELFEKICDLLEEASGVSEHGGEERRNMTQKLNSNNQVTVLPSSEERLLIPDPYFFKPRVVHKNSKFPSQGRGTVSYKKLWKWSHYVKMPSDMWSIHKHPDGSFVIVVHISELSPFPKFIIDKCIIFKETASPCVKIYGKDVLALSSEKELLTLGNVCSFLKRIHDISLCEGMLSPLRKEDTSKCELYTDGKVSLPYKCKSCT